MRIVKKGYIETIIFKHIVMVPENSRIIKTYNKSNLTFRKHQTFITQSLEMIAFNTERYIEKGFITIK